MNITEKLIQLRKSKGISQEELAEKLKAAPHKYQNPHYTIGAK